LDAFFTFLMCKDICNEISTKGWNQVRLERKKKREKKKHQNKSKQRRVCTKRRRKKKNQQEKMSLSSWVNPMFQKDPVKEINRLKQELEHLRHHVLRLRYARTGSSDALDETWSPAIDVKKSAKECLILMDLPGVQQADIDIHLQGDQLVIRGTRNESKEEEFRTRLQERPMGRFRRVILIPQGPFHIFFFSFLVSIVVAIAWTRGKRERLKETESFVAGFDDEDISAWLGDGVLQVSLRKTTEQAP
jgi:HSP20 family protein